MLTRSPGGTWSATNVKDRMVDSVKADTQASLFCQLQAKTWLGPVLPCLRLEQAGPDHRRPGRSTGAHHPAYRRALPDGSHAAQVEGDPTAFAISDGDYGILNASSLQLVPKELPATNAPSAVASDNQRRACDKVTPGGSASGLTLA